jgi:phosphoribosylformimino-5-aminoimidazole carboxamide ribotide isomerase
MFILPAIDLIDKTPVRLIKGEFGTAHVVSDSAIDTAVSFKKSGAQYIHIVDLDGAKSGIVKNLDVAIEIKNKTGLLVEFGGGVRDIDTIDMLVQNGIERVVLGSAALKNKELVEEAVAKYGEHVAVGIDAKNEKVSMQGWLIDSDVNYIDFAKQMEQTGVKTIIFTDISRDGTLTGPNLDQLFRLKNAVGCNIIASGGIKDINDIMALIEMDVYGVIAGKAIYSGNLNLKQAIDIANGR